MKDLLALAPQLGVAAFIIGALVFLRREQLKAGGIERTEFDLAIRSIETKLDRISVILSDHTEQLTRLDERDRISNRDLPNRGKLPSVGSDWE